MNYLWIIYLLTNLNPTPSEPVKSQGRIWTCVFPSTICFCFHSFDNSRKSLYLCYPTIQIGMHQITMAFTLCLTSLTMPKLLKKKKSWAVRYSGFTSIHKNRKIKVIYNAKEFLSCFLVSLKFLLKDPSLCGLYFKLEKINKPAMVGIICHQASLYIIFSLASEYLPKNQCLQYHQQHDTATAKQHKNTLI